jgi:hypothetical protein
MRRTLDELMAVITPRCRVDEDDGCMIWAGAFTFGVCKAQIKDADGKRRVVNVRREILEAKNNRRLGKLLASCKCGEERCVAPDHLIAMSRAQVQQRSSKQGLFTQPHVVAARIASGRKRATIGIDAIRDIRSSVAAGATQRAMANRYGITQQTVWKIVHGYIAAEAANGASVFNWRPAA